MIVADEFWMAPVLRTHEVDCDGMIGRWVEVVEPDWLAGMVAQPCTYGSGLTRCTAEHPSADIVCVLIDGHDGPHWKATRSLLPHLSTPVQIIKGEEFPDVWLLTESRGPLFNGRVTA